MHTYMCVYRREWYRQAQRNILVRKIAKEAETLSRFAMQKQAFR
jgi:hypothetical protein